MFFCIANVTPILVSCGGFIFLSGIFLNGKYIFEMNQKAIEHLAKPYAVVSGEGEERIQNAVRVLREEFL